MDNVAIFRPRGFIQDPRSRERGHLIKASQLIKEVEREANAGCGLHYELFEASLLGTLCRLRDRLDSKADKKQLTEEAAQAGWQLTPDAVQAANEGSQEVMRDIVDDML